jgi:hypothetical protein
MEPYFANPVWKEEIRPWYGNHSLHCSLQERALPCYYYSGVEYSEGIFFDSTIVGMDDLKKIMVKCICSREPINVLLCGPPA